MSPRRGSSAATTAVAPYSPKQPVRVITFAGTRCRINRSLYRSSQQTGANPRPLGECHDNRLLAGSHHAVPEFVSLEKVCPTMVPKLHWCWWRRTVLTAIVSVAFLAPQTCFRCKRASTYQLPRGQSIKEAARQVYWLMVRPAQWPIDYYRVSAQNRNSMVPHTLWWGHPAIQFIIVSPLHKDW